MNNGDVSWIKLDVNLFGHEQIRLLDALPERDSILMVWIRLLTLAGKCNDGGRIYFLPGKAYSAEMLATVFNRPVTTIRLALDTLSSLGMVELDEDGEIFITDFARHQNAEGLKKLAEQRALNRERQRRYRERKKLEDKRNVTVTLNNDAEEEEEVEEEKKSGHTEEARSILDYLNRQTGKSFRYSKSSLRPIEARLKEGFSPEELRRVVDFKTKQWRDDSKMAEYLRPATLFQASKFESYLQGAPEIRKTASVEFVPCPHCGEPVLAGDDTCPHCKKSVEEAL